MAKSDAYRAKHAFGVMYDGEQMTVFAGDYVPTTAGTKGAKLVKQLGKAGVEEHLEEIESFGFWDTPAKAEKSEKPVVEEATSSPGEKRATKPKSK